MEESVTGHPFMICLLVYILVCVPLPLHVLGEQGWGFFTLHSIPHVESSAWHLTRLKNDSNGEWIKEARISVMRDMKEKCRRPKKS